MEYHHIDDSGVNFIYSFLGTQDPQNQPEQVEQLLNTPQHRVSDTPARIPTENTDFDQHRFEDLEEYIHDEEVIMQG